jgi:hypothetical protein
MAAVPSVSTIGISAPLGYNANMVYGNASVDALLRSVDEFFMGEGPVHKTMRTLARRFPEAGVDYAIVGAMAFVMHGYRRETVDVDVLMSREGHDMFVENLVGREYLPLFPGAKKQFRDTETGVEIDIIAEGEYPGDGKPKPVSFPAPNQAAVVMDGIRIVSLEKLVELKLASGMTAPSLERPRGRPRADQAAGAGRRFCRAAEPDCSWKIPGTLGFR